MNTVDCGSLLVAVPQECTLEFIASPSQTVHAVSIASPWGDCEVRAYAAPRGRSEVGGQWRVLVGELSKGLHSAGLRLSFREGNWGKEVSAVEGAVSQGLLGRDDDRCTVVAVYAGPTEHAERLTQCVREILTHTQARRGTDACAPLSLLPLTIPDSPDSTECLYKVITITEERSTFGAEQDQHYPRESEAFFRPRFPETTEPGSRGSAMQQLRYLRP